LYGKANLHRTQIGIKSVKHLMVRYGFAEEIIGELMELLVIGKKEIVMNAPGDLEIRQFVIMIRKKIQRSLHLN